MKKLSIGWCLRLRHLAVLLILGILTPVNAETYRLIDDRYLEIGNEWHYQVHVTLRDNITVDLWETSTESITGTRNIAGYPTKIVEIIDSYGTGYDYANLSNDYLLEYGYDDSQMHARVINNNPTELAPVWINTTDNNRLLGTGDFQLQMDDPYMVWEGTITSYITYTGHQDVTVPAGTFSCIVVLTRSVYSDTLGLQGEITETTYADPEVGVIKKEHSDWMYNPYDGQTYYNESTESLTWTNVGPFIKVNKENIDFGETSTSETFEVWKSGMGTLDYDVWVSEGDFYFEVLPTSGSSTGSSDKKTHTITLKRDNIAVGETIFGEVMISSGGADNSPQVIGLSAVGPLFPDLSGGSEVCFEDLEVLVFYWLDDMCGEPNWCEKSDLDRTGTVDFFDFSIFAKYWLTDVSLIGHWTLDDNEANTTVIDSSGSGGGH